MHRTVWALVGWVVGVALHVQQPALWAAPDYVLFLALAHIPIGFVAIVLKMFRRPLGGLGHPLVVGALAAALAFGSSGWRAANAQAQRWPAHAPDAVWWVTGRVADVPRATPLGWRLVLAPDAPARPLRRSGRTSKPPPTAAPPLPERLLLSWVNRPGQAAPRAGERWGLAVRLRPPHGVANPHGFDTEAWLASQGLGASGTVSQSARDPAPQRLAAANPWALAPVREALRDRIHAALGADRPTAHWRAPAVNPPVADAEPDTGAEPHMDPHVGLPADPDADPEPGSSTAPPTSAPATASPPVTTGLPPQALPARVAGLLAALVVGDQAAIDRDDWTVFRVTGVAHLVSISGLHITLWAWLMAGAVGGLWRAVPRVAPVWGSRLLLACPAPVAAAWGGLALAAAYAVFSGWGVPAQRTVAMLAVVTVLRSGQRRWPWGLVLGVALAVVLAIDPMAWRQPGFWLSFVAVGVLWALPPPAQRPDEPEMEPPPGPAPCGHGPTGTASAVAAFTSTDARTEPRANGPASPPAGWGRPLAAVWRPALRKLLGGVAQAARVQVALTWALAPLTLVCFNQVSVVGALANAVAIPVVTLVVTPLALLGVWWSPLWSVAGAVVAQGLALLHAAAAWPWASLMAPALPPVVLAGVLLAGALLALPVPWALRALVPALLWPAVVWQPQRPPAGDFEVVALDVGQGSAVLVRTATSSLLVDAGPQWGPHQDAGQRVVVPLLQAQGERPDRVVLTHADADHVGGALAVLAQWPDAQVLASFGPQALASSALADPALRAAWARQPQAHARWQPCTRGQVWVQDGVRVEVLGPKPAPSANTNTNTKADSVVGRTPVTRDDRNNRSCVLWVRGQHGSALLTGDLDARHEAELLAAHPHLQADWLLAPHHGSAHSSSLAFLRAVSPRWVVVQAGYRNRYGHPAPGVLQRYDAVGARWVASPSCGAATWSSAQPDALRCHRSDHPRHWWPAAGP